jgi:hypothetical protein
MTINNAVHRALALAALVVGCAGTTPPATTGPGPAASATASSEASAPKTAGMPERADTCATDQDCGFTNRGLEGRDTCCNTFKVSAGTTAWVKSVEDYCAKLPPPDCGHIPVSGASARAPTAACVAGHCQASK